MKSTLGTAIIGILRPLKFIPVLVGLFCVTCCGGAGLHASENRAKPMQVAISPRLVPDLKGGSQEAFIRRVEDLFVNKPGQWRYVAENISHFKFYSTPLVWMTKKKPEYSYERIENTKNGWEKLKAMEAFCRKEGIEFYFLFNDHTGGRDSDKLFHDNVMKCLRSVKSHGLTPELGTIQSWYKHPLKDLPEDQPYTFMYLANEFIQESKKTGNSAQMPMCTASRAELMSGQVEKGGDAG